MWASVISASITSTPIMHPSVSMMKLDHFCSCSICMFEKTYNPSFTSWFSKLCNKWQTNWSLFVWRFTFYVSILFFLSLFQETMNEKNVTNTELEFTEISLLIIFFVSLSNLFLLRIFFCWFGFCLSVTENEDVIVQLLSFRLYSLSIKIPRICWCCTSFDKDRYHEKMKQEECYLRPCFLNCTNRQVLYSFSCNTTDTHLKSARHQHQSCLTIPKHKTTATFKYTHLWSQNSADFPLKQKHNFNFSSLQN